jgi:hypothetical protein
LQPACQERIFVFNTFHTHTKLSTLRFPGINAGALNRQGSKKSKKGLEFYKNLVIIHINSVDPLFSPL